METGQKYAPDDCGRIVARIVASFKRGASESTSEVLHDEQTESLLGLTNLIRYFTHPMSPDAVREALAQREYTLEQYAELLRQALRSGCAFNIPQVLAYLESSGQTLTYSDMLPYEGEDAHTSRLWFSIINGDVDESMRLAANLEPESYMELAHLAVQLKAPIGIVEFLWENLEDIPGHLQNSANQKLVSDALCSGDIIYATQVETLIGPFTWSNPRWAFWRIMAHVGTSDPEFLRDVWAMIYAHTSE